tara:strand:+ start:2356 stop:2724 length:369 start_codon:yes stop_codon:yes gene_type:complete
MGVYEYEDPNTHAKFTIEISDGRTLNSLKKSIEKAKKISITANKTPETTSNANDDIKTSYFISGTLLKGQKRKPEYTIYEHNDNTWSCNCPHYFYRLREKFPNNIPSASPHICKHISKAQKM